MTERASITSELGSEVDPEEGPALDAIAHRLVASRPLPDPGLRAKIRARYATTPPAPAPANLRSQILAYAVGGFALIALAAIGLAGVGPLS